MPGISEIMKSHPGLVWGVAGGAVLGVGYILLKGKGSDGGQASAFPPQYTLGGVLQGGLPSVATGNSGGVTTQCQAGYHFDALVGMCVPNNVAPHPGPLPGPQPNPNPNPHPGPLPGPIPIGQHRGDEPVGPLPPFYTPTIGASQGLYSNVLSAVSAQNNMSMSE